MLNDTYFLIHQGKNLKLNIMEVDLKQIKCEADLVYLTERGRIDVLYDLSQNTKHPMQHLAQIHLDMYHNQRRVEEGNSYWRQWEENN